MNIQPAAHKFTSMTSLHSLASIGYLPPGHGYVPKKQKPDKPYGPNFVTIMNRTWRGPGRKYLNYAMACFCVAIVFYCATALYFGHRNVSRMIVLHTEVMGAIMCIIAILMTSATVYFIYKGRLASNRWRAGVRFRAEGLYMAAAYNQAYSPEDETQLMTGTYGPRAVKEIPRPPRGQKRGGRSRAGTASTTDGRPPQGQQQPGRIFDKRGMARAGPPMEVLSEDGESDLISDMMPYSLPGPATRGLPYPPQQQQLPPGVARPYYDMDEGDSSSMGLPPSYTPQQQQMKPLGLPPPGPPRPAGLSSSGATRGSREELDMAPPLTPKAFSPPALPQVHRAAPPKRSTPQPAPPPGGMTYSQVRQGHGVTRGMTPVSQSEL